MINIPKVSSSIANTTRVSSGEIWSTWITPWGQETRTWAELASLMENGTRISSNMTNVAKPA